MPDEPAPGGTNLPAKRELDRAALERVLARAAELQAHDTDPGIEALSEENILEIGREVGLAPRHLQQALAEEQSHLTLPEERGFAARIAGPAMARASRTVPGKPAEAMARLAPWMEREECLQVKRRFPDRTTWEPRRGWSGALQRGLNIGGRGYALARAEEVAATAVAVDETRSLVVLEADLTKVRGQYLGGGGAVAATGIGVGSGAVAIASMLDPTALLFLVSGGIATVGSILGIAGGFGIARQHMKVVARAQLALEQLLDRLERDEGARPALPGVLSAAEQLIRGTLTDLNSRRQWPK